MAKEIIKKVYKKYFDQIVSGEKDFEIRLANEEYKVGDVLVLKEIDDAKRFTGREIRRKIKYMLKTKDINFWSKEEIDKFGFVVLGMEK